MNLPDKDTYILGIESSCDETAASVVLNGRKILSNVIASQADFHMQYGGVVPEIASRMHLDSVSQTVAKALSDASLKLDQIDAVAVTYGPGLVGALLVGVNCAKGLCAVSGKPLVAVDHLRGHIAANYLCFEELEPPFLTMLVSGGNTMIVSVKDYCDMEIIGRTLDDAAGEAFDKIARVIGLGYPGGPKMDKEGQGGDISKYSFSVPRTPNRMDFSFSGIKTNALNMINESRMKGTDIELKDFTASYQHHIAKYLYDHVALAVSETGVKKLCLAGGVSANSFIRNYFEEHKKEYDLELYYPKLGLCTDNAAMIASCGYYEYINGNRAGLDLNARPSLRF